MTGVRVLIVLFASALMVNVHGQECRPLNDSAVLVDFYGATKGLNWKVKWDLHKPVRTWKGVTVNASGCVTRLELPHNNIQGNITDLDLPFLERFDVSENNILSSFPALSKLPSLEYLNISGNRFRGSLPALANSTRLEVFEATGNLFDGSIPDYSGMSELRILNLSNNNLTDNIEVVGHLRNLTHLFLNNNQLQGSIPELKDAKDLVDIDLSMNRLTGSLPVLDGLGKLTTVNLSENRISGSFQWPQQVPELQKIDLSSNLLMDTIPNTGPVGKLIQFVASNNQFTGKIPHMDLPSLERLQLAQNKLTGSIPDLADLPQLEQFSFRHNELKDIDFEPGFLNGIVYSDISENYFTFEDMVPFRNFRGTTINLFPQKKIPFKTPSFTVTKGNNYVIELDTDENHGSTDYQWFRNGERLATGRNENFSISNVIPRDAGVYTVNLTNSQFAGFPIMSEEFTLVVNCPQVIAERKIYLCPEEEFVYKGVNFSRDTVFADTVVSQNDLVCDSLYLFDIQTYEPDSIHVVTELCGGEIYYFGPDSIELTKSGIYLDTFPNLGGCDSIVLLDLGFRQSYARAIDVGICPGDSLVFQDSVYYEDVDLVDSFATVYGCDSLIFMKVRFSDPVRTTSRYDICEGDSIQVDGMYYSSTASWVDTLSAVGGCDSISTVEVNMRERYEETFEIALCSPDTYEWQGMELEESGFYSDTLQSSYGCDSIVHLDLMISPSYSFRDTISICPGDSILFNGTWLTGSGIYFSEHSTISGCDSMSVLVIKEHDYAEQWWVQEICAGDTVIFNEKNYFEAGMYLDTLKSEMSCDTVVTIEIIRTEFEIVDSMVVGAAADDSSGSVFVEIGGGETPYQYLWNTGDTTALLDSVPPGDYTLEVTDALGCTTTFDLTVPLMTFVRPGLEQKNWISIRPNLVERRDRSSVYLDVQEPMQNIWVYLYNEIGRPVSHKNIEKLQVGESLEWSMDDYPAGMYYFHIREEGKSAFQVERLMVF